MLDTEGFQLKSLGERVVLKNLAVRKAGFQDVDGIHEVLKRAFERLGRGYSSQAIKAAIVDSEEIAKRMRLGGHVLVAEFNNEIVGTVSGFEEHGSMRVCSLAVHPAHQNCGVAHQLMERLEMIGHRKRCYKLFLQTAWAMKEAIQLYESLGYVKEGYLREHFYGEDFLVFSKLIKRS